MSAIDRAVLGAILIGHAAVMLFLVFAGGY